MFAVCCREMTAIKKGSDSKGEESSRINDESSGSSIEASSRGGPVSKASTFRSMLGGGRTSGALDFKGRLRRLRKLEDIGDNLIDGGGGRESRGRGLQRFGRRKASRRGSRPPVQPAGSLSSGEGTEESSGGGTNVVSGDDVMSPASSSRQGFVSSPEGMTTDSSDEESDNNDDLDSANRRKDARGSSILGTAAKPRRSAGRPNFQGSQMKNSLLRLTRRRSRQPPAPLLASRADSSSASNEREEGEEEEEEDDEEGQADRASLADSSTAGASLLDNRLGGKTLPTSRGPRGGLWKRTRGRESGTARLGKSAGERGFIAGRGGGGGGDGSTGRSPHTGAALQQSTLPSWPRVKRSWGGWGSLGDSGGAEVAPVSGMGRPAAGALENALYGWFGGVVGRNWPGVGLAAGPLVDEEDSKQVNFMSGVRAGQG